MKHSLHDLIVIQPTRSLNALKGLLLKGREFAKERKFDENLLLEMRAAPDMFNFTKQIQIVTDSAKGMAGRMSGRDMPKFEDNEKTLEELLTRIDKTLNYLKEFSEKDFEGYEKKEVTFFWNPGKKMLGADYVPSHALPTFYFHMTTAYLLLRSAGVNVGKGDFLGSQNWQNA